MKIGFVGDISLNNRYNALYKLGEQPFSAVTEVLGAANYVVGNLECLSEGVEENLLKRPRLKTEKQTLNFLASLNMGAVTLAHNHVYDNCIEGFVNTTEVLDNLKIRYLGAGIEPRKAKESIMLSQTPKIALLNYVHTDTNPNLPPDADVFLNYFDLEQASSDIQELKLEGALVFVSLHWGGGSEGRYFPDWEQRIIARQLIEAGADLIVGHHSHTLQPFEIYRGRYVFYSLGNFCFDDVSFENKIYAIKRPSGTESAILTVHIDSNSNITPELIPINKDHDLRHYRDSNVLMKVRNRQVLFKVIFSHKLIWSSYLFFSRTLSPIARYFFGGNVSFLEQVKSINFTKVMTYFAYLRRVLVGGKN